jgi:DNA-binding response OmpR family regulator
LSLVQLGKDYIIKFDQQPPSDMILSLSLPDINGDNSQYLSASITYKSSNVIVLFKADGTKGRVVVETD